LLDLLSAQVVAAAHEPYGEPARARNLRWSGPGGASLREQGLGLVGGAGYSRWRRTWMRTRCVARAGRSRRVAVWHGR
jgi:hypothetical protein